MYREVGPWGRAEERTKYILDRLAREGEVSVAQLASDLGVSPVTVRASLKTLDEQGYLVRTHGGARPTTFRNIHLRQMIAWTRRSALLGRPPT